MDQANLLSGVRNDIESVSLFPRLPFIYVLTIVHTDPLLQILYWQKGDESIALTK